MKFQFNVLTQIFFSEFPANMEEYTREPCPYRIVDDCGGAFAMGCIGGGVFQAIKGFRNAPSGFSRRLVRKNIIKVTPGDSPEIESIYKLTF